jgi:hypothetical protein
MAKMSETELVALIDTLAQNSYGYQDGELSAQRAEAIARYNSEPFGDEIDGRSSLVSSELRDTVETVIPQVMKVFLGGDEVVKFDPHGPEDEQAAEQETKYVNHCITQRNPVYQVFGTWFRDALLCKNGYVSARWETKQDVRVESYEGLSEDGIAILQADKAVEIVAVTPSMDPMYGTVYAVKVRRVRPYGYVCIDNVPSEEMRIHVSTRGVNFEDCIYVEHFRNLTLSEIRQMGHKVDDDIAETTHEHGSEMEAIARDRFAELTQDAGREGESSDPATRRATFRNIYIRVDEDGDGIAELRNIIMVNREILHDEEAEFIPFACITPVIQPHRHIGYGYHDFLQNIERARTAMLRAAFDNQYLANNGRYGVNVNNVNIDDLLVSRPGGIVRVDGEPGQNIFPITHPTTAEGSLGMMTFLTDWKKSAVGVVLDATSLSADVLNNSTASAISQAVSAWQARIEAVARTFAETGIKELFRIVHALILKHGSADRAKLGKDWVEVDPREWVKREHLTVTVGLGTGSKEAKLAQLYQFANLQAQGLQIGVCTPQNLYETGVEIVKEMGFKDEERFVTDPRQIPPQPPKPDPLTQAEQIKQQGAVALEQLKQQQEKWKTEFDGQVKIAVAQIAAQTTKQVKVADVATEFQWMNQEEKQHQDKLRQENLGHVVNGLATVAGMAHQSHESGQDRMHQAQQSEQDKAFQAHQHVHDQAFQAHQSDADRRHQASMRPNKDG